MVYAISLLSEGHSRQICKTFSIAMLQFHDYTSHQSICLSSLGVRMACCLFYRSLTDKWYRTHVLSTEYSIIHYWYPLTILTSVSSSSSSSASFLWNTSELGVSSTTPTPSSAIPVGNFNLLSNPSSSAGISSGARYRSSGFLHRCELKWRSLLNFWLQVWQIRLPCSSINCNK